MSLWLQRQERKNRRQKSSQRAGSRVQGKGDDRPAKNYMGEWTDARDTPKVKLRVLNGCLNFGTAEAGENWNTPHSCAHCTLRTPWCHCRHIPMEISSRSHATWQNLRANDESVCHGPCPGQVKIGATCYKVGDLGLVTHGCVAAAVMGEMTT